MTVVGRKYLLTGYSEKGLWRKKKQKERIVRRWRKKKMC